MLDILLGVGDGAFGELVDALVPEDAGVAWDFYPFDGDWLAGHEVLIVFC